MPNIIARLPQNSLNADAKARLAARIADADADVEQIPDEPSCRSLCWVLIEEIAQGCWTCGGIDMTAKIVPVMLQIHIPAGVVDDQARSRYAGAIANAVESVFADEPRRVVISSLFLDVADSFWGVGNQIWRRDDFIEHAGYRHLQQSN